MRFVLAVLVLANLALFLLRFDVTRELVGQVGEPEQPAQLNAQRLRIVREAAETSITPSRTAPRAQPVAEPPA